MAAILMIDDERAILELVKNGLRKDGHFVTTYTSAAQVPLDKLNRYDLIILDIMMPDIDGFSYCDKIRSLVDYPILFLTAKTMEHDITFGLGLGADDYLTKPFRIAELRARVNAHLRRERRERHTALTFDRIKIDLSEKELRAMGQLVSGYLDFAERQAEREQAMTMRDWAEHLDRILTMSGEQLLQGNGSISHKQAVDKATGEYKKYKARTLSTVEEDYLNSIKILEKKTDKKQ